MYSIYPHVRRAFQDTDFEMQELISYPWKYRVSKEKSGIWITDYLGDKDSIQRLVIPDKIQNIPVKILKGLTPRNCDNDGMSRDDEDVTDESPKPYTEGIFAATSIKEVIFPDSLVCIGDHSFHCCEELTKIKFPASLKYIEAYAFSECYALTEVIIPNGTMVIEEGAFFDCDCLKYVYIPQSVEMICYEGVHNYRIAQHRFDQWDTFPFGTDNGDLRDVTIEVAHDNPCYCSVNGMLFDKHQTVLIYCFNSNNRIVSLPNTVKSIAASVDTSTLRIVNPENLETVSYYDYTGGHYGMGFYDVYINTISIQEAIEKKILKVVSDVDLAGI